MQRTQTRAQGDVGPVRFAPNPIERVDPELARAFEAAVSQALPQGPPLVVQFGMWDGDEGVRYFCKLEAVPDRRPESSPAWRWWSALVRTPAELAAHVVEMRGARKSARPDTGDPSPQTYWGWAGAGLVEV
jgi:hypothetical protein